MPYIFWPSGWRSSRAFCFELIEILGGTFGSRGFGFKVGFLAYGYGSIGWLSIQSRWSCKTREGPRLQNPLIKEYTLNLVKIPIILED